MLKVIAMLPEARHFRQVQDRGNRHQWVDRACNDLRILSDDPDPWEKEWAVLVRLEQGKTRMGRTYPKRLNLVALPIEDNNFPRAKIVRDRWSGKFGHSCEPTLLHFDFPVFSDEGSGWLMLSVVSVVEKSEHTNLHGGNDACNFDQ